MHSTGQFAGTLRTPVDIDWHEVAVREGYTTRILVRSDADLTVETSLGNNVKTSSGDLILGPEFGLTNTGDGFAVPVSVRSAQGTTTAYEFVTSHHRVATFAIDEVGDVQANGIDHVVMVILQDHRGKRDAADDSTRARVRHVSGPGSVKALDTHLSGGQLRL